MKRKLSPEELHLWKAQLKDVKPLSKTGEIPEEAPAPKRQEPPQLACPSLEKKLTPPSATIQDLGKREMRRLKIDGRLDMHGMSMDQAHAALEQFLIRAQERGFKIVLIITGKGALSSENTLRYQLPRWIKESSLAQRISSFHAPARPQDGGQGACYIGVRKRIIKNLKKS